MMNKVLIIGGGPAGLVLGQILLKNNIPFEIFERDENADTRSGWAVVLAECIPELEKELPKETASRLPTLSVNYDFAPRDEVSFVNAVTGERVGSAPGPPRGEPGYLLRLPRDRLRSFLWDSNALPVTAGKRFERYEEDAEGVTAVFSDGTCARGALLVGADGAHSRIRAQLIGAEHQPVLSKYVPIFGEAEYAPVVFEPIRKLGNAIMTASAPGIRYMVGLLHMAPDRSRARYYWCLLPRYEDEQAGAEMSRWVTRAASQQELYDKALEIAKGAGFAPELVAPIREGGVEGIFMPQPAFVEFHAPDPLPAGRVVLMGDAAHTMVPFRAAGANTAVRDACDLGRLLTKGKDEVLASGDAVAKLVQEYNSAMLPRGKEMVMSSHAAGELGEGERDPAGFWAKMFERNPKNRGVGGAQQNGVK